LNGTGGHFVPYKDTPRGDMLGTLVVCLPAQFSNGAVVVKHRGVFQTYDWGQAISGCGVDGAGANCRKRERRETGEDRSGNLTHQRAQRVSHWRDCNGAQGTGELGPKQGGTITCSVSSRSAVPQAWPNSQSSTEGDEAPTRFYSCWVEQAQGICLVGGILGGAQNW
jgi:hypothetical protein